MRRVAAVFAFVGLVVLAAPGAAADQAEAPAQPAASEPAGEAPATRTPNRVGRGAIESGPVAITQRKGKGSGFWTSDVPTPDRPYRWGYMGLGAIVMALMGGLVFLLVRRASRQRDRGPSRA